MNYSWPSVPMDSETMDTEGQLRDLSILRFWYKQVGGGILESIP